MKNVLVTGAGGCVGHYVVDALLQRDDTRLFLVLRSPEKFRFPLPPERTEVIQADVCHLAQYPAILKRMDAVVHLATAWGDPVAYEVNVEATLTLFRMVDAARCRRILYFSTASILDSNNQPNREALTHGTDYIRSKYLAHHRLDELPNRPDITTLYPTLVFGGGAHYPISHLSRALPRVEKALTLIRPFTLDGTLHFIHAADIARMVAFWLDHPPPSQEVVLGNAPLSVDELIQQWCDYAGLKRQGALNLAPLARGLALFAGKRMNSWDRYSLINPHFKHQAHNPSSLGLPRGLETLAHIIDEWHGVRPAWPACWRSPVLGQSA
jgi:nucleoside-diphosphate-sugar epimerase